MYRITVICAAGLAVLAGAALFIACDVSSDVEEQDAGGGGEGSDAGVKEDGGAGKDAGTGKDAGALDDVPPPDDAGGGDVDTPDGAVGDDTGTGDDTGAADGGGQDIGPQTFSISGTVTVEGKKPAHLAAAVLIDRPPGEGIPPVAFALCDADGHYTLDKRCDPQGQNCVPIGAGTYWMAAIYDVNDDGNADPGTGDPYAFYARNPIVLPGGQSTGIDMDIVLNSVAVSSIYVDAMPPQIPVAGAYLIDFGAVVRDPASGALLSDAVVNVTDGVNAKVHTLVWDAQRGMYVMDKSGAQSLYPAIDGMYEFTITHAAFGGNPLIRSLRHVPLGAAVKVTAPANNVLYDTPQDVVVSWTDPPTAQPVSLQVQEAEQNGQVVYEKPVQGSPATLKSPETVPAASFSPATVYVVRVIAARVASRPAGVSYEMGLGQVLVRFK